MDILEDSDDFDFDQNDDDEENSNDEDDEDSDVDRPRIRLTGPFRYEVVVQNTESISKFVIKGKKVVTDTSKSWDATLESKSKTGTERRLDLSYRSKFIYQIYKKSSFF